MRALAVFVALAFAAVVGTSLRRGAMRTYFATETYEDVYYLPDTAWLSVLSLGHREAAADLVYTRALIYTGDEFYERGDLENVFRYADAMLALDPDFRAAYLWVSTMGIYRPHGVTLDDHRRTLGYLERAVARFPNDGELEWNLGALMAYELAPLLPASSAERRQLRERAREHLIKAVNLGKGPEWLAYSNAMDQAEAGEVERALAHLRTQHAVTSDDSVRTEIEHRIQTLEGESAAHTLRAAREDFARRHQAEFPYLRETLYMLVAPRIERASRPVAR
jgi:tetratricopeptide (TPR) repeat protein